MSAVAPFRVSDPAAHTAVRIAVVLSERLEPRGQRWRVRLVSRGRSSGGSLVFRADGETGSALAVKVHAHGWRALAEHDAARAVGARAAVPAPVLVDPSLKLNASRWVDGQALLAHLGQPGWEDALVQAGRWLRRFHRLPRPRVAWYRPNDALVRLRKVMTVPSIVMPSSEAADFGRCVARLERRAACTPTGPFMPARLHGDFHYNNLIMSLGGPVGIDLGGAEVGPLHGDLARMTTHLELLAEMGPPSAAFDAERARGAVLRGYGLRGSAARARLALSEAAELLVRWRIASGARAPKLDRSRAARAVLDKRGWVVAATAMLFEPAPPHADISGADRRSLAAAQARV